jgi:hypothetical protein
MTTKLSEKSGVFLIELVFTGRTPKRGELRPEHRNPLVRAGLITLENRGRYEVIVATDAAWDWVAANLELPLRRSRPTRALAAVLARLRGFLSDQDLVLVDFVQPRAPAASGARPARSSDDGIGERIRTAYLTHTNNEFHTRMRLTALRVALADIGRSALDAELRRLAASGRVALFPLDDRSEISATDARDAIDLSGVPQHVIYLEG